MENWLTKAEEGQGRGKAEGEEKPKKKFAKLTMSTLSSSEIANKAKGASKRKTQHNLPNTIRTLCKHSACPLAILPHAPCHSPQPPLFVSLLSPAQFFDARKFIMRPFDLSFCQSG